MGENFTDSCSFMYLYLIPLQKTLSFHKNTKEERVQEDRADCISPFLFIGKSPTLKSQSFGLVT